MFGLFMCVAIVLTDPFVIAYIFTYSHRCVHKHSARHTHTQTHTRARGERFVRWFCHRQKLCSRVYASKHHIYAVICMLIERYCIIFATRDKEKVKKKMFMLTDSMVNGRFLPRTLFGLT